MPLPPAPPGNLICKGRATSTGYPHHLLDNLLFGHLGLPGDNIINYMHHIPDDRKCVRHLPDMLLLDDLLHVCRPGRRSFTRWENTRVRDFVIPSHVARSMMPWSLTPISQSTVEPRVSVHQHSGQQLRRHLNDGRRMFGNVMYKG